ncbi:MAG: two-component system, NtrC family, nitrogen regulation sensor histidine kinase NtrY [Acidobacteriaceae bacterium]|nr:two-component system, NtrC family, nitrogen regulation sensor histidine kinase NtrY [Acidobacteriaceae bacterium]
MSLRTKLLLIFMLTVAASVTVVAYGVTHYTRAAFEEMDAQRTEALVAQFQKEFAQRGEEVVHQVENIANAEITLRMALDLARSNADQSLYVHDGTGAAQDHGLDFVQFVNSDGTLISSAQFPSRVGYKNEWVIANKNWRDSHAFLTKEELPDSVALSLTVVRTLPVGDKNFYIIGGRRLDQNFLASLVLPAGMRTLLYQNLEPDFAPAQLTDAGGAVPQADRYASLIEQSKKQPQRPVISTINWSTDPASAETFHAIPLTGRDDELLGILLVGSSRRELVLLTQRIGWIAASVGAGALLIALVLIWWFSARITHPVEELAVAAREVASGRWDARIDVRTYDEVGQLATAFNDMTRTLGVQKERLLQTERVAAWRELARKLAHELRNPLFPLQITVENLQRARKLDHEQFMEVFTESTATLKTELANLNSIVARFSDFSKMPAPRFERMNVNESLHEALRLFDAQFNEVGKPAITRELFLKEGLPEIDGDPELLHRAFQNVVLNALDAMPAGGTLTLRTSELDGKVHVEIADTGNGLTPEESARLFTPYYTTKPQGTGLGLAIVQSVVSDHHGTVSISSEEGRGTTIRIDLPQRQADRTETPHNEVVIAKSEPTTPSTLAAASD